MFKLVLGGFVKSKKIIAAVLFFILNLSTSKAYFFLENIWPKYLQAENLFVCDSSAAEKLFSCYSSPRIAPPTQNLTWIKDYEQSSPWPRFKDLSKTVTAYVIGENTKELNDAVWKCLLEREPCNIEMNKYFNQENMQKLFGYSQAGYIKLFEKNKNILPPNIAVFCKTPIWHDKAHFPHDNSGIQLPETNEYKIINLLNVIGFAFDSIHQVDYQYFLKNKMITNEKREELTEKIKEVFDKIFYCAIDKKLSRIVLNLFGCSAFAKGFPPEKPGESGSSAITKIYFKSLESSLSIWKNRLQAGGINEISLMGGSLENTNQCNYIVKKFNFHFYEKGYGHIPGIFLDGGPLGKKEEIEKTLFTNAWDSLTVAGNGNFDDPSLDGFWGRISAISVLCEPKINLQFTQDKIKFIEAMPKILFFWQTGNSRKDKGKINQINCWARRPAPPAPEDLHPGAGKLNPATLNQCLSNWYPSPFNSQIINYLTGLVFNSNLFEFPTMEHFLMFHKIWIYEQEKNNKLLIKKTDQEIFELARSKILDQNIPHFKEPWKAKESGKGYSGTSAWHDKKEKIAFEGLLNKFYQNEKLKAFLLRTGNSILAEANPDDSDWGIGMDAHNPKAKDQASWPKNAQGNVNLLGSLLMKVRDIFLEKNKT